MKQLYPTNFTFTFRLLPLYRNTSLFLLIFLLNFTLGFGQEVTILSDADEGPIFTQQQTIPLTFEFDEPINAFEFEDINVDGGTLSEFYVENSNYERLDSIDLDNFSLFSFDRIIVSIDVNSNDEVFILTQGQGVKQLVNGEIEDFIDAEFLTAPYDLAISNDDKIYIADNGTYEDENDNRIQDRRVKVFDENGSPLFDEYLGEGRRGGGKDQFYGPIGLAFDEFNNLYVADYYDGTDSGVTEPSRIKIYYHDGEFDEFFGNGTNKLKSPYRLAVHDETLYIADLGDDEGNGRVQYFDVSTRRNEVFLDVLEDENLKSPGSIVIDDYGFIYVADFGEEINLSDIIEIDFGQVTQVFNSILAGLDANGEIFNIDVFDLNHTYRTTIKNDIDLPVDLALNNCNSLLVHNVIFSEAAQVDVDIEFYNRLPNSFTANLEIADQCIPAEVSVGANVGEDAECNNTPASGDTFIATWDQTKPVKDICIEDDKTVQSGFIIPNYTDNEEVSFNDNCGVENLTYSQTPEVGETITQTTTVSISATDKAGNVSDECTFDLVVEAENTPPIAEDDEYEIDQDETLTRAAPGVLENDTDTEGDVLTAEIVTQPEDGTVTLNSDGSFIYEPNAGYFGTDTFTYIANDGEEDSNPATVSITVNEVVPPNTTPQAVNDEYQTDEDETLTRAAPGVLENDTDDEGDALTAEIVTQPENGTVTLNSNGSFTYEPNTGYSGSDSFTYIANDGNDNSNEATVNITVNPVNSAPVAVDDTYNVDQGAVLDKPAPGVLENDIDDEDDVLTVQIVTPPANGTLTLDSDGSFTYEPNAGYFGTDTFTYIANDGEEDSAPATVNITVNEVVPVNRIPNALAESYTINQGEVLNIDAPGVLENDSDPDGDNLTAELRRPAAEGDFSFASNGSFTYEPAPGFTGVDDFIYVAYDGEAFSGEVRVTITVNQENSAPIANPDAYSTEVDTPLNISAAKGVLANDSDPDGDALIAIPNQDVTGGTLTLNEDGSFSYVPETGFTGSDTFTYFAFDGEIQVETTVSIVVTPNDSGAPVANDDFYSLNENEELQISAPGILRNDSDPEDRELIPSVTANTSNGTLVLSSDGAFVYTPNPGFSGTDSFSYLVNNGDQNSNVATVTLSVEPLPNDAPIALPDSYSVLENGELIVNAPGVIENDYDPDGDPFTAILLDLPTQGTIDFNPDGSFTYIPNSGYTGPDSFTYMLNDEKNFSNEVTVTITVNARNPAPQFEDCPTLIQRNVSTGECEALVMFDVPTASDDSGELTVNLISELGSGDLFPVGTTTVIYEATGENGERITCSFEVMVVDNIPPNISCPGDQIENFDPETGFEVPNYESWATFSDNCGEVSFRQEPEAGAIIFQDTTVQLFAEDANEQVANCSFELQLTEANVLNIFCQIDQNVSPDEDCSFTLPDYTDTAEVSLPGATVTQSPPEGTVINGNTQVKLTATLNGETDECFFMVNLVDNEDPVANCVSGYVVNLDESGNATLAPEMLDNNSTDNCGIVSMALSQINFTRADIGEVPITLTVRDDAGNMDTCETTVEVVDENSGEFECRENVLVNLNENGEAVLSLQELYMGNASGLTLEASRLNFICSDLGMVQIQLDYSGVQTGSCTINVEVRDEIPPLINTDIVELTLDDEGFAYLEEGDVLAENNCGAQFIYRFSKSVFNCEDVGVNTVNVEVEDANGNIAEKNIEVRVNGEACEIPDNEDLEFLFIYPNPNNGTFTIATPEGMQVEQVRVFDSRGRFILQKEYKDIARFYRMTIEGVESSVYTLQIFTNEGVVVKRVIISQ